MQSNTLLQMVTNHSPPMLEEFFTNNKHIIEAISNTLDIEENESYTDRYGNRVKVKITPNISMIFSAFHLVSFDKQCMFTNSLKVVLLFQDTYPTPGAACGIALATLNGNIQDSLMNFYKRIQDTYIPSNMPKCPDLISGDIRGWCNQGVLMLNSALTTRAGQIGSHIDQWSIFTTQLIKYLSDKYPFLVFGLFGKVAQGYHKVIGAKHAVHMTSHPSGRGMNYGFNKCDIFNAINTDLANNYRPTILWENYKYI